MMHVIFGYILTVAGREPDRRGRESLLRFEAVFPGFIRLFLINDSGAGQEIIPAVLHEEMGIPEIKGRYFFIQHFGGENGVSLFFDESDASVCRFGEALPLQVRLGGGIDQVQVSVFLDGGSGAAAAPDFVFLIGDQGDGQHVPVHEVIRREMAPVHDPPLGFVGIVLEEEMRLSVIKNSPVRVIAPARRHGCVVMRSVALAHFYLHNEAFSHSEDLLYIRIISLFRSVPRIFY